MKKDYALLPIFILFFSNCGFYNLKRAQNNFYFAQVMYQDEGEAIYEDVAKSQTFLTQINKASKYSKVSFQKNHKNTKAYWIYFETSFIRAFVNAEQSQLIYLEILNRAEKLSKDGDFAVKMKACYYMAKSLLGLNTRSQSSYETVVNCSKGKINSLTAMQYMEFKEIILNLHNRYVTPSNINFGMKTKLS